MGESPESSRMIQTGDGSATEALKEGGAGETHLPAQLHQGALTQTHLPALPPLLLMTDGDDELEPLLELSPFPHTPPTTPQPLPAPFSVIETEADFFSMRMLKQMVTLAQQQLTPARDPKLNLRADHILNLLDFARNLRDSAAWIDATEIFETARKRYERHPVDSMSPGLIFSSTEYLHLIKQQVALAREFRAETHLIDEELADPEPLRISDRENADAHGYLWPLQTSGMNWSIHASPDVVSSTSERASLQFWGELLLNESERFNVSVLGKADLEDPSTALEGMRICSEFRYMRSSLDTLGIGARRSPLAKTFETSTAARAAFKLLDEANQLYRTRTLGATSPYGWLFTESQMSQLRRLGTDLTMAMKQLIPAGSSEEAQRLESESAIVELTNVRQDEHQSLRNGQERRWHIVFDGTETITSVHRAPIQLLAEILAWRNGNTDQGHAEVIIVSDSDTLARTP